MCVISASVYAGERGGRGGRRGRGEGRGEGRGGYMGRGPERAPYAGRGRGRGGRGRGEGPPLAEGEAPVASLEGEQQQGDWCAPTKYLVLGVKVPNRL